MFPMDAFSVAGMEAGAIEQAVRDSRTGMAHKTFMTVKSHVSQYEIYVAFS